MIFVERIEKDEEIRTAADILVEAYWEDPVFLWAMPEITTRRQKASFFFVYVLRKWQTTAREIFITSDRSAVAVVKKGKLNLDTANPAKTPTISIRPGKLSPAADFFQWIEKCRPEEEHDYLEFIGSLKNKRNLGRGSVLLNYLLEQCNERRVPLWCWSSNKRNLPFYQRLGFRIERELVKDSSTPAVTALRGGTP